MLAEEEALPSIKKAKGKSDHKRIIACYGQFWDGELVDWKGVRGKKRIAPLLGGQIGGEEIDFADQIGIYVLYDERYEPVYAGQVGRSQSNNRSPAVRGNTLFLRLKAHAIGGFGGRWRFFSWYGLKLINANGTMRAVTVRQVTVKTMIDALEAVMIASFEPRLNSQSGNLASSEFVKQLANPEKKLKTLDARLERIGTDLSSLVMHRRVMPKNNKKL